mmetsp:Transcript_17195/g.37303  ORF Transcript_17195/g.37303 Transcript_17195/m.37303 type:complete len:476 (-) Transcript_17195:246-1673(-)
MVATSEWIKSGDRSHPNLKLIDEVLRHQSTYPGYESDLQKLESLHFAGNKFNFEQTLHRVRESQRIYKGNRSHDRLVKLDALRETLTYHGWKEDWNNAEFKHVSYEKGYDFERIVLGMKRKQALYIGDRTHEDVQFLDSLSLTYPGWKDDVRKAIDSHQRGFEIEYDRQCISERQRMFEGDRSHPRLVALDSLKLTYPGWKRDIKEVEEKHLGISFWCVDGVNADYGALLNRLERKQSQFMNGVEDMSSMNPFQRQIVETHWTYPGHEDDVKAAKLSFHAGLYCHDLEICQIRQMIHDKDFGSHPALIKLGEVRQVLSYPGYKTDMERTRAYLSKNGYHWWSQNKIHEMIEGMKNKQHVYDGSNAAEVASKALAKTLDGVVSGTPTQVRRRSGPMRFLPRLSLAVPVCLRRKTTKRSEQQFGCCIVCFDAPRTHVFVPCGHMCACQSCSQKLMKKGQKCPMCTQTASMAMEVFLP